MAFVLVISNADLDDYLETCFFYLSAHLLKIDPCISMVYVIDIIFAHHQQYVIQLLFYLMHFDLLEQSLTITFVKEFWKTVSLYMIEQIANFMTKFGL